MTDKYVVSYLENLMYHQANLEHRIKMYNIRLQFHEADITYDEKQRHYNDILKLLEVNKMLAKERK
ncbi:hypothetical protein [Leuconostoc carnosum]|uniref:hypothetical protein n=1 Tax=Leuconostoc carnosum TaxID=1252 RepID=UPI0010753F42|nr:hypothetical protein [Leuconostoc carnosum]